MEQRSADRPLRGPSLVILRLPREGEAARAAWRDGSRGGYGARIVGGGLHHALYVVLDGVRKREKLSGASPR